LGLLIIEVKRQFMQPSKDYTTAEVDEVRDGLGFAFLHVGEGADPLLSRVLRDTVSGRVEAAATRWDSHGSRLEARYEALSDQGLSPADRDQELSDLASDVAALPDPVGGW
jgi:hypothetical protein